MHVHRDSQHATPYASQLEAMAALGYQRFHVPAHQGDTGAAASLASLLGARAVELDFPMLITEVDLATGDWHRTDIPTPIDRSLDLAAQAWGAARAWYLTNGASIGNQVMTLALGTLGREVICQRSVHSSTIDGMMLAGLDPLFVQPSVDLELGSAHGVTAAQVSEALAERPGAVAVIVVSPSYFGAVADIAAIAEVVHAAGKPLIVDEAWGSHFGFHPGLPTGAIRAGADLVISSTHKGAGSLTQSAMLLLGDGPHAEALEAAVERVMRTVQSTSSSALLMASLDHARRYLATEGERAFGEALEGVARLRAAIARDGRFAEVRERILEFPDVADVDPLKVVIDTRVGGISGHLAQTVLMHEHRVIVEMATDRAIVLVVGPGNPVDVERLMAALTALPREDEPADAAPGAPGAGTAFESYAALTRLAPPAPGPRTLTLREAFFAPAELVDADAAIGRVSSDSLAAYPPGIPNATPGEVLTEETVRFLQAIAQAPSGYVRGAAAPGCAQFRVVR